MCIGPTVPASVATATCTRWQARAHTRSRSRSHTACCSNRVLVRKEAPIEHERMKRALVRELETQLQRVRHEHGTHGVSLSSIYFGGGTPSLALPSTINAVIETALRHLDAEAELEITMEANPTVCATRPLSLSCSDADVWRCVVPPHGPSRSRQRRCETFVQQASIASRSVYRHCTTRSSRSSDASTRPPMPFERS